MHPVNLARAMIRSAPAPTGLRAAMISPAGQVSTPTEQVCARLPSADSAYAFITGQRGAFWLVLRDWIGRSALIGLGLWAAGLREKLWRYALAGGASIELFVLLYIATTTDRRAA